MIIKEDEKVYFEIRNILLKVREYKRSNSLMMSSGLIQILATVGQKDLQYSLNDIIEQIFQLQENDEFIQIAFVNFYAKLISSALECQNWLNSDLIIKMLDSVSKQESHYQLVYFEKRLKLIRNIFELPPIFLSHQVVSSIWHLLKASEMHQNLLIKEMSRDVLSQAFKRQCCNYWEEIYNYGFKFLLNELVKEILQLYSSYVSEPGRANEITRLIEYPLQILQFVVHQFCKRGIVINYNESLKEFIIVDVVYVMIKLSRTDHQVLMNIVQDMLKYILQASVDGQWQDVLETRTLVGQVILNPLQRQMKRINQQQNDQLFSTDSDVLPMINFLKQIFINRRMVSHIYFKCDINPALHPLFEDLLEAIFELSRVSRKMLSDEARFVQASIQELLITIFQCAQQQSIKKEPLQDKYSRLVSGFKEFIDCFNNEEQGPRKALEKLPSSITQEDLVALLKTCNRMSETSMIEILGYHKEKCVAVMEGYLDSFDFAGISITEGLRLLLSNFLLFGESQMIERVLNKFTLVYFQQNGNEIFTNSDSLFTYTYALILLNTDLYNRTVITRMSIEDFMKQCSKINDGKNLPEQYVRDSYASIANDEIKCLRDFARTEFLTRFVWHSYYQHKQRFAQEQNQCIRLFEQEVDFESVAKTIMEPQLSELLFQKTVLNIEQMVVQYGQDGLEDLSQFLQDVLQVCVDNDKLESAQMILDQLYRCVFGGKVSKQVKTQYCIESSLHIYLYTCFLIAEYMLQYTTFVEGETSTMVELIRNTIQFRVQVGTEVVSAKYVKVLQRIRSNSKFARKNLGMNSGIFSLFQRFLQQEEHDDDESEDESLKPIESTSALVGMRDPNILLRVLEQTKYQTQQNLEALVLQILNQILKLSDLDADYVTFTQLLFIITEVMRINGTRLHQCWSYITPILCLTVDQGQFILIRRRTNVVSHLLSLKIKKRCNQRVINGFLKYWLLKLEIQFSHLCEELEDYSWCFQYSLGYLDDQSLEILVDFLQDVKNQLSLNYLDEAQFESIQYIISVIIRIYEVLQQRSLDPVDAKLIQTYTQNCLEMLLLKKTSQHQQLHLNLLNCIVRQPEVERLSGVFVIKHLSRLLNSPSSNSILDQALILLQRPAIRQVGAISILQLVTLNYDYKTLQSQEFKVLWDRILSFQAPTLQSKQESSIIAYAQLKSRVYFCWVFGQTFDVTLWNEVLNSMVEVIQFTKNNKLQSMMESLGLQLRSVVLNSQFQQLISSQPKEVLEKIQQVLKSFGIPYDVVEINQSEEQLNL